MYNQNHYIKEEFRIKQDQSRVTQLIHSPE